MTVEENVSLKEFTTFKIGGPARYFARVRSLEDLKEAAQFLRMQKLHRFILGGGSNLLVSDAGFDGMVIKMENKGISFEDGDGFVSVTAEAGEKWDDLVALAVERGLYGIENLSLIPGTVGGAAVQNIGAYGSEAKDAIVWVEAFDLEKNEIVRLSSADCQFGYRESIFKTEAGENYVVLRVCFKLFKSGVLNTDYKDVRSYFDAKKISSPTLRDIRTAIIEIRTGKLPGGELGTAGSFFKNPVIKESEFALLKQKYPDLPSFSAGPGFTKFPLAWVLDNVCHLKGVRKGDVGTFQNQPLVLVNYGDAKGSEVASFASEVTESVRQSTGIEISPEVEYVGS